MKKIKQKGFTLVEIIIYVVIFNILIFSIFQFVNNILITRIKNQETIEVNNQGSQIINVITQTIRNGSFVGIPSSNTLIIDGITFVENEGILYLEELGSPIPLNNNRVLIDNISFSNLKRENSSDIVKIRFTLKGGDSDFFNNFYGTASIRK